MKKHLKINFVEYSDEESIELAFRNSIIPIGRNVEWVEKRTEKGKELTQKYRNKKAWMYFKAARTQICLHPGRPGRE